MNFAITVIAPEFTTHVMTCVANSGAITVMQSLIRLCIIFNMWYFPCQMLIKWCISGLLLNLFQVQDYLHIITIESTLKKQGGQSYWHDSGCNCNFNDLHEVRTINNFLREFIPEGDCMIVQGKKEMIIRVRKLMVGDKWVREWVSSTTSLRTFPDKIVPGFREGAGKVGAGGSLQVGAGECTCIR